MKGMAEPQELLWGYKQLTLNRCDCSKPCAVLGLLCLSVGKLMVLEGSEMQPMSSSPALCSAPVLADPGAFSCALLGSQ